MKRIYQAIRTAGLAIAFALAITPTVVGLGGCTTTAPGQLVTAQDFNKAYLQAVTLVDATTTTATTLVKANILKGQDADNTIAIIKQAQTGLALARSFSDPQQGITKLSAMTATLLAAQAYLATLQPK